MDSSDLETLDTLSIEYAHNPSAELLATMGEIYSYYYVAVLPPQGADFEDAERRIHASMVLEPQLTAADFDQADTISLYEPGSYTTEGQTSAGDENLPIAGFTALQSDSEGPSTNNERIVKDPPVRRTSRRKLAPKFKRSKSPKTQLRPTEGGGIGTTGSDGNEGYGLRHHHLSAPRLGQGGPRTRSRALAEMRQGTKRKEPRDSEAESSVSNVRTRKVRKVTKISASLGPLTEPMPPRPTQSSAQKTETATQSEPAPIREPDPRNAIAAPMALPARDGIPGTSRQETADQTPRAENEAAPATDSSEPEEGTITVEDVRAKPCPVSWYDADSGRRRTHTEMIEALREARRTEEERTTSQRPRLDQGRGSTVRQAPGPQRVLVQASQEAPRRNNPDTNRLVVTFVRIDERQVAYQAEVMELRRRAGLEDLPPTVRDTRRYKGVEPFELYALTIHPTRQLQRGDPTGRELTLYPGQTGRPLTIATEWNARQRLFSQTSKKF